MTGEVNATVRHQRGPVTGEPDPVAIERALAGKVPPPLRPVELRAVVLQLGARGMTPAQIARQIGCSSATAGRHLRSHNRAQMSEAMPKKDIARTVTPEQRREVLITADAGRVVLTDTGIIRMRKQDGVGSAARAAGIIRPPTRCDSTVKALVAAGLLHERKTAGTYALTDAGRAELERIRTQDVQVRTELHQIRGTR